MSYHETRSFLCSYKLLCGTEKMKHTALRNFFAAMAGRETDQTALADLNVITTCGVTQITEQDSFERLQTIARERKQGTPLVISGCLPNICRKNCGKQFQTPFKFRWINFPALMH